MLECQFSHRWDRTAYSGEEAPACSVPLICSLLGQDSLKFLVVQWKTSSFLNAEGVGLISVWGTKILHATQRGQRGKVTQLQVAPVS